jgi:hypothetical protein
MKNNKKNYLQQKVKTLYGYRQQIAFMGLETSTCSDPTTTCTTIFTTTHINQQ